MYFTIIYGYNGKVVINIFYPVSATNTIDLTLNIKTVTNSLFQMIMKNFIHTILILLSSLLFNSCSVVGGIFNAGVNVGIFISVFVIALIVFFVLRIGKRNN